MRPQTVSYRRALLIAALPGIGMWRQLRDERSDDEAPFSRKPTILEIVPLFVAVAALLAAVLAGGLPVQLLAGFATVILTIRPLGRLLIPRRLAHTERELLAATTPRTLTHLVFVGFLVLMAIAGNWLALGIAVAVGVVALLLGAYLVQLMLGGLVNRRGGHATR